ncbi:MAG: MerR family transcriptional regulator [Syntrophus sp. (in: bacteria)]
MRTFSTPPVQCGRGGTLEYPKDRCKNLAVVANQQAAEIAVLQADFARTTTGYNEYAYQAQKEISMLRLGIKDLEMLLGRHGEVAEIAEFKGGKIMEYSTGDMERSTGVTRLRLHGWIKDGLIVPSAATKIASGHGVKNKFAQDDLYKIALLRKLIESGIHGKAAAALIPLDWTNLKARHEREISRGRVRILCAIRRFDEYLNTGIRRDNTHSLEHCFLAALGDHDKPGTGFADEIMECFAYRSYDYAIIVNLSKLIEEAEVR